MKEHVYCIYDILYGRLFSDGFGKIFSDASGRGNSLIVSGIAKFKGKNYYFERLRRDLHAWGEFADEITRETCKYYLTLLDENVFKLSIENWEYVKKWFIYRDIPDPCEYMVKRETMTFSQIFSGTNIEKNIMEKIENYYQNEIIIRKYLENTRPTIKTDGIFYSADGKFYSAVKVINSGIKVKWKNKEKILIRNRIVRPLHITGLFTHRR
jgi:hypothetical protein